MYKKIEIFKTEFDEQYILLFNNKTLIIGCIVKDIVELMQNGIITDSDITAKIEEKYNQKIDILLIEDVKLKINCFIENKSEISFVKLFKLFNPNKINSNFFNFFFSKTFFFSTSLLFLFVNILIASSINNVIPVSFNHWIIWLILLLFILLIHEIGHSVAAKKFNVNCTEIGLGLYLIFPVFYINLGEIWKLKKEKRIIINLAGIYFQLIIGIIIFSANYFIKSEILTHLFFTNFSITLLNLNPFIKFDGYWIISDLLFTKNLLNESKLHLKKIFKFNFSNYSLTIYTILRIVFVAIMLYYFFAMITNIALKIFEKQQLSVYDYLIITILTFYTIKKIFKHVIK